MYHLGRKAGNRKLKEASALARYRECRTILNVRVSDSESVTGVQAAAIDIHSDLIGTAKVLVDTKKKASTAL